MVTNAELRRRPIVFVAGLHRSGTTLIANCLREHPSISGFRDTGVWEDEGQLLQHVLPTGYEMGGPGRFGFHRHAHLTEESPFGGDHNGDRLVESWREYWDPEAPFRLEKSPPNLLRTTYLQALFPAASFIVIRRHPIAAALATRRFLHWSRRLTGVPRLVRHWVHCHRVYGEDRPRLQRVLDLRLEDLVADPERRLKEVFEFLGLDAVDPPTPIRQHVNRSYERQWRSCTSVPGLGPMLRARVQAQAPEIRPLGYDIDPSGRLD